MDSAWIQRGFNMKVHLEGAPPNFSKFPGPKHLEISIFFAPVAIVKMFASHVPRRIQILGTGDGLEGHFQPTFQILSTIFLHKLGEAVVDLGLQTISEALPAAKRANYFRR